jgi:NTP pyrophosphatase (non-canonical NTP hydrolase)
MRFVLFHRLAIGDAYLVHLQHYDATHYDRIKDQLIEEMAELTVALQHERRGRRDRVEAELHQVLLCVEFLMRARGSQQCFVEGGVAQEARNLMSKIREGRVDGKARDGQ